MAFQLPLFIAGRGLFIADHGVVIGGVRLFRQDGKDVATGLPGDFIGNHGIVSDDLPIFYIKAGRGHDVIFLGMNGLGIGVVRISKISDQNAAGISLAVTNDLRRDGLLFVLSQSFAVGIVISPCRASGTGRQKERYYKGPHEDGSTFYHRGISSHLISYLYFILYDRKFPL